MQRGFFNRCGRPKTKNVYEESMKEARELHSGIADEFFDASPSPSVDGQPGAEPFPRLPPSKNF